MTRWHDPSCFDPHVTYENGTIHCETCRHTCPSLSQLISNTMNTGMPVAPPDEHPGHLNLWWPLSVNYITDYPDEVASVHSRVSYHAGLVGRTESPSPSLRLHVSVKRIYGRTLLASELRLACISAAIDADFPIHISLETFSSYNRPEYEAVSYTWGGEDGDSSLAHPVYIGPYWDVLLQTKNCWEMLHFVRPWRGVRMLWVDAVCINQNDMQERSMQVAKMRKIYADCLRVIVYLGSHLVTASRAFPAYQSLSELETEHDSDRHIFPHGHALQKVPFGLKQLLQRRYFSRIWVIQELIMADRAVIRIGDVDFFADRHCLSSFTSPETPGQPYQWDHMAAPWFQFLGQRQFSALALQKSIPVPHEKLDREQKVRSGGSHRDRSSFSSQFAEAAAFQPERDYDSRMDNNARLSVDLPFEPRIVELDNVSSMENAHEIVDDIYRLVQLTANSHAADPRDRLFGVISLLPNMEVGEQFPPDYNLSHQHFFVGLYAHFLTNLRMARVLRYAAYRSNSTLPSWVPDTSPKTWQNVFGSSSDALFDEAKNAIEETLLPKCLPDNRSTSLYHAIVPENLQTFHSRGGNIYSKRPWDLNCTVNSDTGALTLYLTHFFTFEQSPHLIGTVAGVRVYESRSMLLTTKDVLGVEIVPYRDHVFILDPGSPNSPPSKSRRETGRELIYLILRQENEGSNCKSFQLIASIYLFVKRWTRECNYPPAPVQSEALSTTFPKGSSALDKAHEAISTSENQHIYSTWRAKQLPTYDTSTIFCIQKSVGEVIEQTRISMSQHINLKQWRRLLPGQKIVEDSLLLAIALTRGGIENMNRELVHKAWDIYKALGQNVCGPYFSNEDGYIEFLFQPKSWADDFHDLYILPTATSSEGHDIIFASPATAMLGRASYQRFVMDSYLNDWYAFPWEWKHEGKTNWQKTIHRDLNPFINSKLLPSPDKTMKTSLLGKPRAVCIRAPASQILLFIGEQIGKVTEELARTHGSYFKQLELESVLNMIEQGAEPEHYFQGVPKDIGGYLVHGSTFQVQII